MDTARIKSRFLPGTRTPASGSHFDTPKKFKTSCVFCRRLESQILGGDGHRKFIAITFLSKIYRVAPLSYFPPLYPLYLPWHTACTRCFACPCSAGCRDCDGHKSGSDRASVDRYWPNTAKKVSKKMHPVSGTGGRQRAPIRVRQAVGGMVTRFVQQVSVPGGFVCPNGVPAHPERLVNYA
jgi:hypothetical protein